MSPRLKRSTAVFFLAAALASLTPAAAELDNAGFETGSFSGWTKTHFRNPGLVCERPPCPPYEIVRLPGGDDQSAVVTASTKPADPIPGPRFGQYAALVNGPGTGYRASSILQRAQVTAEDVDPVDGRIHIRFAVAPVAQDPPEHPEPLKPWFHIAVRNVTRGNATLFERFLFADPSWKKSSLPSRIPVLYLDWQDVDVAPSAADLAPGDTVELEVVAADCAAGAHYGYIYVDGFDSRTVLDLEVEKVLCVADGSGAFTLTFQLRNRGPGTVHHLVLEPRGGFTVAPDRFDLSGQTQPPIPYPRPVPPGALSEPLTVTIRGAAPGSGIDLALHALDESLDEIGELERTVELPRCDCAQVVQITPACRNLPAEPASFDLDFSVQNLTTRKVSQILVAPHKPPTVEIHKNRFDVLLPQRGSVTPLLPIHVDGPGAGSTPVCFLLSLWSDTCESCCSIEQCVTPDFCNGPFSHKSLGDAQVAAAPPQVVATHLGSTGDDGVEIGLGQADGFTAVWSDLAAAGPTPGGARLLAGATGSVNGQSGRSLGLLAIEDTGADLTVTADFASLGISIYRIEVYRAGALVTALDGGGGAVAVIKNWPTRGGYVRLADGGGAFVLGGREGVWRLENGLEVTGDELRVVPGTAARVDSLTTFSLRAADIPGFVIVDEIVSY